MKRTLTLVLALFIGFQVYSQTQRKVLVEEFTQASCGPCASANPALNALLQANLDKATAIKYQVWWPGYDPMYFHNTADVDTRVALYNVSGVPNMAMDGDVFQDHPNSFNQTILDNEYAVASPFDIDIVHSISADFDSIYITVTITAEQDITGSFTGFAVMTEDHIEFATAPGTNGETEFFNVMKKMFPDANGYTLPSTWVDGQVETMEFAAPIPWYVYKINEIAVVAFVQDLTTKNVKQAAFNEPIIQPGDPNLDASITTITGVPVITCSAPFNCDATLKNIGSTVLTSADVNYQIDNDPIVTIPWTGSLAANATAQVTLTGINGTSGGHSMKVWVSNPNGIGDLYPFNNSRTTKFFLVGASAAGPVEEGFQGAGFPPAGWYVNDASDNAKTWVKATVGGYGQSNASVRVPFYDMATVGEIDELFLPPIDMTNMSGAFLWFDVANARYNASYIDRMKVMYSTDCGLTWNTIYDKSGAALSTVAAFVTSSFVPNAAQWRTDLADLSAAAGQAQVIVKFQAINGYGNNLYLDNIRLYQSGVGMETQSGGTALDVMPNPFSTTTELKIQLDEAAAVQYSVYNTLGSQVFTSDLGVLQAGTHSATFDGSELQSGIYYMMMNINGKSIVKKLTVN